jgi:hypothetical protein
MLKVKEDTIKISPEKEDYFNRLEELITKRPEAGIPDVCLLDNGKTISCFKQTIKLFLFSGRIRYERSQLTAQYIYNDDVIYIFNLYFSI